MISLPWRRQTLEQMLDALAACGVSLREGASAELLVREKTAIDGGTSRATLEKGGFESVLIAMGDEIDAPEGAPVDPPSDDVWHFDVEFIEDHGAYRTIVERLCKMTHGDFRCDRVDDYVDVDAGVAWVELTRAGETERVTLRVDNDWTDERIFSVLQEKLAATGSAGGSRRSRSARTC
jgi:hypothetical protein